MTGIGPAATEPYRVKNFDRFTLTTSTQPTGLEIQLLDRWMTPHRGQVTFVWQQTTEQPSVQLVHKTIRTLAQKNHRTGFHVYQQQQTIVEFGMGGLRGGGKKDTVDAAQAVALTILLGTGLFIFDTFQSSPVRPYFFSSGAAQGLLQAALYSCLTPSNERTNTGAKYEALRGAVTGALSNVIVTGATGILARNNIVRTVGKKAAIQALASLAGCICQQVLKLEEFGIYHLLAAALSGGTASLTSSGLDRALPQPLGMKRFVLREAIKEGTSASVATFVYNLIYVGPVQSRSEFEGVVSAFLSGSTMGALGAVRMGCLPQELRERLQTQLTSEQEKLGSLEKDYIQKRDQYDNGPGYGPWGGWSELRSMRNEAKELFEKQAEAVKQLEFKILNQDGPLTMAQTVVAAIPNTINTVDPLVQQLEKVSKAIVEAHRLMRTLKSRRGELKDRLDSLESRRWRHLRR